MKKVYVLMLSVAIALTMMPSINLQKVKAEVTTENYGLQNPSINNSVAKWDTIYFGSYPQSKDNNGGFKIEPIKWRVLSIEGDRALLLSDKNLDAITFDKKEYSKDWGESAEREWLNNQFFNTAFTEDEQNDIYNSFTTIMKNSFNVSNTQYTWDKAFLLDYNDVLNESYGFKNGTGETKRRKAASTDYALSKGTKSGWTLRSKIISFEYRSSINKDGKVISINAISSMFGTSKNAIRPAIQLDLSTVNWTYGGTIDSNGNVTEPTNVNNPNEVQEPIGNFISADDVDNPIIEDGISMWDCVYYGKYPQTLASDGSFTIEPIKWRVLSKDGDDLFLMADKTLDARYFHTAKEKIKWEYSDTRWWMNKDFLNRAFSKKEQDSIKITNVTTPNNPKNNRSGGANTEDKMYLLSYDEIQNADYGFTDAYDVSSDARISYISDYSYYQRSGSKVHVSDTKKEWWYLRSPGSYDQNIGIVGDDGWSDYKGTNVHAHKDYVRPVMHLDAASANFTYAGTVSSDGTVQGEEGTFSGVCGDNLNWQLNIKTGKISISGSGTMYDYDSEADASNSPWNRHIKKIKSVELGENVESIGSAAFRGCSKLEQVYLPLGINSIANNAFDGCSNNITFDVVKDTYAEQYCISKGFDYNIRYENQSGTCGNNLNWEYNPRTSQLRITGTGNMNNYNAQGSNTPWSLFKTSIESVVIEDGVTSVGNSAFVGCNNLTEVFLPLGINSIADNAFDGCSDSITFNVVRDTYAERYCIEKGFNYNVRFEKQNGVCGNNLNWEYDPSIGQLKISGTGKMNDYNAQGSNTPWYLFRTSITDVVVEDGVTSIGKSAFKELSELQNVALPDTINSIGISAFQNCIKLEEIIIPDSVTTLKEKVFSGCTALESINIPNSTTQIETLAFEGCSNITELYLPYGIEWIADNAFNGYNEDILFDVANYSYAEQYCVANGFNHNVRYEIIKGVCGDNLKWEFNPSNNQLRIYGSGYMDSYSAESGQGAFTPWRLFRTKIKTVVIENGVKSIGDCAFRGLVDLRSIIIPNTVDSIGVAAFQYCLSLTGVRVPDGVTVLSTSVFSWCRKLQDVELPDSISTINSYAFEGCCEELTSIVIPAGVKTIYNKAFYQCNVLRSIYLPDNITSIGNDAFLSCPSNKTFSVLANSYGQQYCQSKGFAYTVR